MSKLIRQLLEQKDPRFSMGIARLEESAGKPGIDVRLTAEIISTTRTKITSLGLDPMDTTGAELYAALSSKLISSEEQLLAHLGHPANIDAGCTALVKLVTQIVGVKETWAVKHAVLRKIIKDNPPKRVMKAFHYQSAESMSKRMEPAEVVLAARLLESKAWWLKTRKAFDDLTNKDFEKTKVSLIPLNDPKWMALLDASSAERRHIALHSKECAAIGFLPSSPHLAYVTSLISILYAMNEVLLHGAFLKLHFVNPSIGNMLVHAIDEGSLIHASVAGTTFHWREVQRYFGTSVALGERMFSHLDVHDLGWIAVEAQLSLVVPEFAFWVGLDFCGISYGDGKQLSCNLFDVAESVVSQKTYDKMYKKNMQRSLRGELLARYLQEPAARALVLKQFDISPLLEENW
jgi:hypothetical protein